MKQLVEGYSTLVEIRAPEILTDTCGDPTGSRYLPKGSTKAILIQVQAYGQLEFRKKEVGCCGQVRHNKELACCESINF